MHLSNANRRARYALFILFALTVNIVDTLVTRSTGDPSKRLIVAAFATIDLVVVVSLSYYWLLVRPGMRTLGSLAALSLLGLAHATYLFPNANALKTGIAGLCEISLLTFVILRVRKARAQARDADPLAGIEAALGAILPPLAATFAAVEIGVLYYAFFSWRAKPSVPPGTAAFSIHRKSGQADVLHVVALACLFEIVPVHLLLRRWSPAWAWAATALSVYSAIWLVGVARSIVLRTILIGPDALDIRYGLLFRLKIPKEMIAALQRIEPGVRVAAIVLPRGSDPNVCIELMSEMEAQGPFGSRKRLTRIALAADEPFDLHQAISRLMEAA